MPSPAKNSPLSNETDYKSILALCDKGDWGTADKQLEKYIKAHTDEPKAYSMAAHVILRQGNINTARWLINKSQALDPKSACAQIEDICLDFYEARYESAYRKIFPALLQAVTDGHPFFLVLGHLCCLYNDKKFAEFIKTEPYSKLVKDYLSQDEKNLRTSNESNWNAVEKVFSKLNLGDKLMACIVARYTEMLFPSEANTYAAVGIFNLQAGFYQNAGRNFHEAIFRETDYVKLVESQQLYLFSRQQRFAEAIKIALKVEQNGNLDARGQTLLLEATLNCGYKAEEIKSRIVKLEYLLKQSGQVSPELEVIKLRLQLREQPDLRSKMLDELSKHVNHSKCNASLLYFYADLLAEDDISKAKKYAARALAQEPINPNAARWDDSKDLKLENFEYAGLFIPKEHDGGAWPTDTQIELLNIIFCTPKNSLAQRWKLFTQENPLYTLEAGAARLLPFTYKKLIQSLEPQDIAEMELLRGIWKKTYYENALQFKNIFTLIQQLEGKGVEVVLLKGMANVLMLYDDLGARPMSDIDILIPFSQFKTVDSYLTGNGWRSKDDVDTDKKPFAYARTYRDANGNMLDVHWRPCENINASYYDHADIGELSYVEFLGKKWATLSCTMNLLCTILHGVEWNHLTPVRWVSDALLILQKYGNEIDWIKMYNIAEKYHCLPILAVGLQFLTRFNKDFINGLPTQLRSALDKNYDNDTLVKTRLRSRNNLSNFEEAYSMLQHYKNRFLFGANDHLFICGGEDPERMKKECDKYGINWAPHFDYDSMLAVKTPKQIPYNLIAINANLSCYFQYFNVQHSLTNLIK